MDFRHNHFTIVLGAFLTSLYVFSARVDAATTINARSPSFADVATAVTTAQDGDTVSVPAGSATWTTALTISKGITLQGATRITTNTSAHPPTYGISPDSASTVITTNVTVITAHVPSGKIFRVSGFTFRQNGTPGSGQTITINGSGTTYADVSRIRFNVLIRTYSKPLPKGADTSKSGPAADTLCLPNSAFLEFGCAAK